MDIQSNSRPTCGGGPSAPRKVRKHDFMFDLCTGLKHRAHSLLCILLVASMLHAEVIDRILAVVQNRIITLGDVRQERSIQLALGGTARKDDSAILGELIDVYLIEAQIAQFPGVEIDAADVEAELTKVSNRGEIALDDLRQGIRRRLETSRYFDLRFRQFISTSEAEIQTYYAEVFVPEARRRGLDPVPPLQEVARLVTNNLVEEKLEREVQVWLESVRQGSAIETFD